LVNVKNSVGLFYLHTCVVLLQIQVIKDYKLYLVVTVLLFIDAALLVTWQILDPLKTSVKSLTTQVSTINQRFP